MEIKPPLDQKIQELREQILQLIQEMRINNNRNMVNEVQKLQKEYWELEMQRDVSGLSEERRKEILEYMMEFVPLGIKNGYFYKDNILDVLEQLTKGVVRFEEVPVEKRSDIYGEWDGVTYKINPNNPPSRQRNTTFHELAHCVTRLQIENDNFNGHKETVKVKIIKGAYTPPAQKEKHKSGKIKISINDEPAIDLDKRESTAGWRFISEVVAEEMAQTLYYDNNPRPAKSPTGNLLHNILPLESNWMTEFNRHYQQFGEEFAQNLYEDDGTKALKSLTVLALDKNMDFQQEVTRMYGGSKEEFDRVLTLIGAINATVEAFGKVNDEKLYTVLNECEELLQRHIKTRRTKIQVGISQRTTTPEEMIQTSKHLKITPSSIMEASSQTAQNNPGKLSGFVRKIKAFFSKLLAKLKGDKEK